MRLLTSFLASLCDDSAEAGMVLHNLLDMPTIVTVSPLSLAAGDVEVADRASGELSVRPIEIEPLGAA